MMARDVRSSRRRPRDPRRLVQRASPRPSAPVAAARSAPEMVDALRRVAEACAAAAVGLDACAKHAHDRALAGESSELAREHRALADELAGVAASLGAGARRSSTCERLRWEWLASTAGVLDGAPDTRLFTECLRTQECACHCAELAIAAASGEPARVLRRAQERLAAALGALRARRPARAPKSSPFASP